LKKQKMMKHLRPYRHVIFIVVPIVILVLVKSLTPGSFRPDANKLAKASYAGANLLNQDQVSTLNKKPLIVKLGNEEAGQISPSSDTLFIATGRLLDKANLKAIHAHRGTVLLVSDDPSISAKAWMILSQMGYRDLYILTEKESSEVLKYKFRPDTAAGI
jgi:hypothetical protein